jgi:uncharacterized protein YndB with AHSA1/START domain
MTETPAALVISKRINVRKPPADAFRVFTEGVASWWPVHSHSIGEVLVETVVLEGKPGGRFYERQTDGTTANWGEVITWDPPHRVVIRWEVNPANPATEIEVRFTPDGTGTLIELEHRGWEGYGDRAARAFDEYNSVTGWNLVLGRYAEASA